MWEIMETGAGEIGMEEAKGRRNKRGDRRKKGRNRKKRKQ